MYLVAGLGNPGKKYIKNRHNVGFMAIEQLAEENNIAINKTKFSSLYGKGSIEKKEVILIKPQTYMNLSGTSIVQFLKWHKIKPEKLIVLYDDMDLPLGKIRIRPNGRSGGHNGLKSIIETINTQEFIRIRIGIDKPPPKVSPEKYVLMNFNKGEIEFIESGISAALNAIHCILKEGIDKAMNKYN